MAKTGKLESAAFTIEEGTLTRVADGSRAVFRFTAPAQRHVPEAGYEIDVYMILHDAQGRIVRRRSAERSMIGNRAQWVHEIDNDIVANAATLTYNIQHRVDHRRKIAAGELPPLPPEADGSDYFRWFSPDPRTLEDRLIKLDINFWARRSYFELTYGHTPKIAAEMCRTDMEIDLLDADQNVIFQRTFGTSLRYGRPDYSDSSISMDRKAMRQIKFFELRGKTEISALAQLKIENLASVSETP
ncbi:MAG: hypothetical protein JO257_06500 [Deltaproteobacteria bacterium]|nr:hypothetical protein [Deltaproteobacteria bacterium]